MRICMLTYYYWPHKVGGAENQCRRLSSELVSLGVDVVVLTGRHEVDWPVKEKKDGVSIRRVATFETLRKRSKKFFGKDTTPKTGSSRSIQTEMVTAGARSLRGKIWKSGATWASWLVRYLNVFFFFFNAVLFFLRNWRSFSLIHAHTADWTTGLAAFVGKLLGIPVLCKGANLPVFPELRAVPLAACCDIWRRKPYFIALTEAMKDDLIQNGVSNNRITVIPNGVRLSQQKATPGRNNNFLYIGNFSQSATHKGFDVLLEAWAAVHRLRPEVKLFMLGGGNADEWIAYANVLGCADSIEFLGYRKELASFFLQTCCLLLPSRKEGISNALLEAQSWGLPAIVSDIPGSREIIVHEINGLIVPVESSEALATACVRLIDNPLVRMEYGNAARKRIEELYLMERIAGRVISLYNELGAC